MSLSLPYEWLSSGHSEQLWGKGHAHKRVEYARLPRLPARDGSFDWLPPLPPGVEGMPLVYDGELDVAAAREHLDRLIAEATARSLAVPAAFVKFMSEPLLRDRIPTVTGSYYDFGEELRTAPGPDGPERLLQFMYELGLAWCLLLEPGGTHRVVTAIDTDPEEPLVDVRVCADSFEEFIERFWIENTLWFLQEHGRPIEGRLRDYLEAAQHSTSTSPHEF